MIGSNRQAGEHEAKWLDRSEHEADGGVGQDLALLRCLMAEGEVARDHLQQQFIDGVEQIGAPAGGGVGDVDVRFDPLHPSHAGGYDGMGRLEARILLAHR